MRQELNARGLTPEEAQAALDRARQFKQPMTIQEWQDKRRDLIKEIAMLLAEDVEFSTDMLKQIKLHHPELLN